MKTVLKKEKYFGSIRKIFLLLGPQCNMKCRHCVQFPIKELKNKKETMANSVWECMDNFISYWLSQPSAKKPSVISFWGGEPLLHWDLMKEIIIYFTNKYNLLETAEDKFSFHFVTNGLLLDQEKINFIQKYPIKFSLSYDAPYPFAVRGKLPNSICKLVQQTTKFNTITTFNAINCDYYLALRCLSEKFPNVKHNFNFALLHTFGKMPKDICDYDTEKIKTSVKKLRIAAKLGVVNAGAMIHHIVYPLQYPQGVQFFHKNYFKPCSSGERNLSIKLDGSVVTCHNSDEIIGSLETNSLDEIRQTMITLYKQRISEECKTCEHLDICQGICPFSLKNEKGYYIPCQTFFKPFFTILKNELREMVRPVTQEEKEWFITEMKKDNEHIDQFVKGNL